MPLLLLLLTLVSTALAQFSTILIGGFDARRSKEIYDTVEIVTDTRICNDKIPPFPVVKSGMAAALYNGQEDLLVCGGENRGPWSSNYHSCFSFFKQENRWLEAEPTIYPRDKARAHAIRNFVVMFGGVTGGFEDDWNKVERVPFGYQKWEVIPEWSLPYDLFSGGGYPCSAVVDNRYIHLMGCTSPGCKSEEAIHLRLDVESTHGWDLMPNMQKARKAFGCVATSEGIWTTGGYQDSQYLDTVEFFNLGTEEWETMAPLDTPRGYHTMGLLGEEVPAIFGGAVTGSIITGDVLLLQDGSWSDAGFGLNREKLQGGSTVGYQSSWNCE